MIVVKRIFGVFVILAVVGFGMVEPALSRSRQSAPPAPGDTSRTLTIKGSSSSYVDVDIADAVLVRVAETEVAMDGEYGGFLVEPLSDRGNGGGAVSVRAFDATGQPFGPLALSRPEIELEPGSYRVYLFADGPTVVRVPLDGATRSLRVRPVEAVDVDAAVVDLASARPAAYAARRVSVETRPGSRVAMAILQVAQHHQASRMALCVADPETPDCTAAGRGVGNIGLFPAPSVFRGYLLAYAGGVPSPGPAELVFSVEGVGVAEALLGFYLVVHPPFSEGLTT